MQDKAIDQLLVAYLPDTRHWQRSIVKLAGSFNLHFGTLARISFFFSYSIQIDSFIYGTQNKKRVFNDK